MSKLKNISIENINQSEEVQLAAASNIGSAILYIDNPSIAIQLAAVTENEFAIQYIKNPSEEVQDVFLQGI